MQYYVALLIFGGILILYYFMRLYPEGFSSVQRRPFYRVCIISFVLHLIMLVGTQFLGIAFDSDEFQSIRLFFAAICTGIFLKVAFEKKE